jgi:hypothetical protein
VGSGLHFLNFSFLSRCAVSPLGFSDHFGFKLDHNVLALGEEGD